MAPSSDQCEIYIHSATAVKHAHTRGGFITGVGEGRGRGGGGGGGGAHALTWRHVMHVVSTSMIAAVRTAPSSHFVLSVISSIIEVS